MLRGSVLRNTIALMSKHTVEPKLTFAGTAIYVADNVPAVLEFYRRAFGLQTRFYDSTYDYGELETDGSILAFATHKTGEFLMPGRYPRPANNQLSAVEVAFFTADVAAAFARAIAAGASALAEPKIMPWGQTVAYVRGVEGTIVGLATPMPTANPAGKQ